MPAGTPAAVASAKPAANAAANVAANGAPNGAPNSSAPANPAAINPAPGPAANGSGSGGASNSKTYPDGRIETILADGSLEVRHPANGVFDVVVTAYTAIVPEAAGILKGTPIQTVYLNVAPGKEWILQYCAAGETASPNPGMIVRLDTPPPLVAPYPRLSVAPDRAKMPRKGNLLFHGGITKDGRFEQIRAIQPVEPFWLQLLERWLFRPALRDGVPQAVEILLIVPPAA
jgi:hypothetical protein